MQVNVLGAAYGAADIGALTSGLNVAEMTFVSHLCLDVEHANTAKFAAIILLSVVFSRHSYLFLRLIGIGLCIAGVGLFIHKARIAKAKEVAASSEEQAELELHHCSMNSTQLFGLTGHAG